MVLDLQLGNATISKLTDIGGRGFAVCSSGVEFDCKLPTRSTIHSAGYDFYAPYDVVIPSLWKQVGKYLLRSLLHFSFNGYKEVIKPTMIKTYIKARFFISIIALLVQLKRVWYLAMVWELWMPITGITWIMMVILV